jgi:cobaltochelatase CobS
MTDLIHERPSRRVSVRELFHIDADLEVPAFSTGTSTYPRRIPPTASTRTSPWPYSPASRATGGCWCRACTAPASRPISSRWRRGSTGPACASTSTATSAGSTWSGKDTIVLEDGKQVTRFQEGMVPWALRRPVALIFDEYDAGRPDVMFVIQRILERDGKFTLLDQNQVISPHPYFRLFATANTVGPGQRPASTTARSCSTRRRWIAGTSSPPRLPAPRKTSRIVLARVPRRCDMSVGAR